MMPFHLSHQSVILNYLKVEESDSVLLPYYVKQQRRIAARGNGGSFLFDAFEKETRDKLCAFIVVAMFKDITLRTRLLSVTSPVPMFKNETMIPG